MQWSYWRTWEKTLKQWGLKPLVCALLDDVRPLIPVVNQMMLIGLPLFKITPLRSHYQILIETLDDEAKITQLSEFLHEVGV